MCENNYKLTVPWHRNIIYIYIYKIFVHIILEIVFLNIVLVFSRISASQILIIQRTDDGKIKQRTKATWIFIKLYFISLNYVLLMIFRRCILNKALRHIFFENVNNRIPKMHFADSCTYIYNTLKYLFDQSTSSIYHQSSLAYECSSIPLKHKKNVWKQFKGDPNNFSPPSILTDENYYYIQTHSF